MYAENVLSVIDDFSLESKHHYLVETLTLLMIQFRALREKEGFCLQVTNNELKYFEGMKFKQVKNAENIEKSTFSHEEINVLLENNE